MEIDYIRISNMPNFASVRHLLQILDNLPCSNLAEMEETIRNFGEQKDPPLDWTTPKSWIEDLPNGNGKNLAKRIWGESSHITNPRYLQAEKSLINRYNLASDVQGIYQLTPEGKDFVRNESGKIIMSIDRCEGTIPILTKLVIGGTSKSANILPDFEKFVAEHVQRSPKSLYSYLISRLNNLVTRGYVNRTGNFYDISTSGKRYLEKLDPENRVQRITKDAERKNSEARKKLKKALTTLNPFDFEALVAELFRKMGYDNVVDTQKSHDGGVDVVAEKDFGFGTEKVVIQVKRYSGNLGRSVVSQLRDDIRSFAGATRGIIVTTSDFNNDAELRAAESGEVPISLINGEKLLNLMIDNELGMKKTEVIYREFDPNSLIIRSEPDEVIE